MSEEVNEVEIEIKELDLTELDSKNHCKIENEETTTPEDKKKMTMDEELSEKYGENYFARLDFDNIAYSLFLSRHSDLKNKEIGSEELLQLMIENLEVEIKMLKHLESLNIKVVRGEICKNDLVDPQLSRDICLLKMYTNIKEETKTDKNHKNMMDIILTYELRIMGLDYQKFLVDGYIETYKQYSKLK